MPDTVRNTAALQTLFADNTSQAITAQDVRDFIVSSLNVTGSNPMQGDLNLGNHNLVNVTNINGSAYPPVSGGLLDPYTSIDSDNVTLDPASLTLDCNLLMSANQIQFGSNTYVATNGFQFDADAAIYSDGIGGVTLETSSDFQINAEYTNINGTAIGLNCETFVEAPLTMVNNVPIQFLDVSANTTASINSDNDGGLTITDQGGHTITFNSWDWNGLMLGTGVNLTMASNQAIQLNNSIINGGSGATLQDDSGTWLVSGNLNMQGHDILFDSSAYINSDGSGDVAFYTSSISIYSGATIQLNATDTVYIVGSNVMVSAPINLQSSVPITWDGSSSTSADGSGNVTTTGNNINFTADNYGFYSNLSLGGTNGDNIGITAFGDGASIAITVTGNPGDSASSLSIANQIGPVSISATHDIYSNDGNISLTATDNVIVNGLLVVNNGIQLSGNSAISLPDFTTISSPTEGMVAWNFTTHALTTFNGSVWA